MIKFNKKTLAACLALVGSVPLAQAQPTFQLDADPGIYVGGGEESTVSTSKQFTLYALFNLPNNYVSGADEANFYIVTSLVPSVPEPGGDFGSFSVNGENVSVTADLSFGSHPDVPPHGVFPTYFRQFQFAFDPTQTATPYNVQDDVGVPVDQAGTDFLYQAFDVDLTGLNEGYTIHFDLVGTYLVRQGQTGTREVTENAPFSHDVTGGGDDEPPGGRVPDGGVTMLLLGSVLTGFGLLRRKLS